MALQNYGNGSDGGLSPGSAAAAAVAAVAHGLRRQVCGLPAARPPATPLCSPGPTASPGPLASPLCSPPPPGLALEPLPLAPNGERFRPFASPPRADSYFREELEQLVRSPRMEQEVKLEPLADQRM